MCSAMYDIFLLPLLQAIELTLVLIWIDYARYFNNDKLIHQIAIGIIVVLLTITAALDVVETWQVAIDVSLTMPTFHKPNLLRMISANLARASTGVLRTTHCRCSSSWCAYINLVQPLPG
jgi:hypothetical protein